MPAAHLFANDLTLAGMDARTDVQPDGTDAVADGGRTADRAGRTVERGVQTVASSVELATAEALDLTAGQRSCSACATT